MPSSHQHPPPAPPHPQPDVASLRGPCNGGGPETAGPGLRLLEVRPFRPFRSSEEYLWAMKEDLAEWLRTLYGAEATRDIGPDTFCDALDSGVLLCHHANNVRRAALEYERLHEGELLPGNFRVPPEAPCRPEVSTNAFHARDNVSNFISFCRALRIKDCLLFETDDLVLRKNEKSVILCLLEVARRGSKVGMLAPLLVQMEEEIDREIAKDQGGEAATVDDGRMMRTNGSAEADVAYVDCGPKQQVINNDLKSLDEMVRDLVNRCTCPTQFYMERISEGKYRIGESKLTIYVRILRSHVMVRVGGGWDTLAHYLDKHDPCRCKQGHRAAVSSKLTVKFGPSQTQMEVSYLRSPVAPAQHPSPFLAAGGRPQPQQLSTSPGGTGLNLTGSPPRQRRASTSSTSSSSHKLSNGSLTSLTGCGDASGSAATTPSPRNSALVHPASCRLSYGGDSSSEHSDEGYRGGASPHPGHKAPPPPPPPCCAHDGPTAATPSRSPAARGKQQQQQSAALTAGRRRRSSGESPLLVNGLVTDPTLRRMQRSRSNDGGGGERPMELCRTAASRHSYRTPRPVTDGSGGGGAGRNNTWSFRGRPARPSFGPDTFAPGRMASPSPSPRGRGSFGGGLRSLQTSPSKDVLSIQEIINSSLDSSEKVDRIQSILSGCCVAAGATRRVVVPTAVTNGRRRRSRDHSSTPPELASPDSGSDMGCCDGVVVMTTTTSNTTNGVGGGAVLALPQMRCLRISPRKDNYPDRESKIPAPKYEAHYSLQPLIS